MNLPEAFIRRTQELISEEFPDFLKSLATSAPVSIRTNNKIDYQPSSDRVKWCDAGYYLLERPLFTADPLLHAGVYYVQEASSMFLQQALNQHVDTKGNVLDLCAAPGGKSTLISQYLGENGMLVSNELIRSRAYILAENLIKWGNDTVVVANNEPKDFQSLPSFFDVVVVDAPCSGEGMFRKDAEAVNEWSEQNVKMCAQRQRAILTDVWDTLKSGGILIYSTCTYNREENEDNVQWIENELGAELLKINTDNFPEITVTDCGYRFFPHKTKGEGFFLSVLRKTSDAPSLRIKKQEKKQQKPEIYETELKTQLKYPEQWKFYNENNIISVFRKDFADQLDVVKSKLRIMHYGITLALQKGKDIIPHTSLALSKYINIENIQTADIEKDEAILFLRKEAIYLANMGKGYVLLTYKNIPIGWVKNLGNRCNNLYPNEWRIRMKI